MEKLKDYFQKVGFDNNEIDLIISKFKKEVLEKGDYFVKQGYTSLKMGFIETGQFQYFSISNQGEIKTTYISLPNTFIASLLSYLSETTAKENIKALSNSVLWVIQKNDVLDLQKNIPKFKDFYIKLIEWQICCIDKSRIELITLTAEQRYERLLNEESEIFQQIPLQYIASMLGISPRHLSRLRNSF